MLTLNDLTLFYPEQTSLELSSVEIETAWQQVSGQAYSSQNARLRAFHNLLSVNALSPFLANVLELATPPQIWLSPDELPSLWEVLNGSILIADRIRLAIIPSDAVRVEELRVEREWIDIPELAAHYYIAVQVDVEKRWLRILGYAPHAQLKQAEHYDATDQTYSLDQGHLIDDLSLVWVNEQFVAHREPVIEPIAPLSPASMSAIIHQLAECRPYDPRRMLPFEQWAEIVAHTEWRQWLYHQRTQASEIPTTVALPPIEPSLKVDLGNWGRYLFPPEWQPVSELLTHSAPTLATAKGIPSTRAKAITLGRYRVALIVSREIEPRTQPTVGIQLEAKILDGQLPVSESFTLKISFLEAEGHAQTLAKNWQANATAPSIRLPRLLGSPGEEFTVTLSVGGHSVIEAFIL
jgi:hypothetical protein